MLLILLALLAVVVYAYLTWHHSYWEDRDVPYDKPLILVGSLLDVFRGKTHIGLFFADLYRKFSDVPYAGYFKLGKPAILIKDPDLIQKILINDFHSFANTDFLVDPEVDPIMAINPFGRIGEEWKSSRGKWAAILTPSKLKAMYGNMVKKCYGMTQFLHTKVDEPVDVSEMASSFFIDIVVSSVFGVDINSFAVPDNHFTKVSRSLFKPTFLDTLRTVMFVCAPNLANFFKIRIVSKVNEKLLLDITKEIAVKCTENLFMSKEDCDKIRHQMETNGVDTVTNYELAGLIFGFLLEGTQTSSSLLAFALYELADNVDVQHKLRDEIDEAIHRHDGQIPYEEIQRLPYLDMVTSEALRLYPPGSALFRQCTKPYTLPASRPGGTPVEIEVGTPVTIPAWGLHMDPKLFPSPETFDPERFTDDQKMARHKFAFLPFGDGPRVCIGSRLALLQTKIGLAGILHQFEMRVAPKTLPKPVKLEPSSLVLRAVGDLWLDFFPIMRGC